MTFTTKTPALGLATLLLLTACSRPSFLSSDAAGSVTAGTASAPKPSTVLLLGDSVAMGQAVPLIEAFAASGVHFRSLASVGGGNVVGPFSAQNWKKLPEQIATARPSVVIYQITTYDWGTPRQQEAAYRRLLTTVAATGAKLIFVSMPPIKPDAFYRPHMSELATAPQAAESVAASSSGKAVFLDATPVWGPAYQRSRNGKPDRSTDGIHTCPQGAARFAKWLLDALAKHYPGFTPAAPQSWANTGWTSDKTFKGC